MKKSSILDYFKCQSETKVNCPACNVVVLKTKLNEHLDLNCSSTGIGLQHQVSRSNAEIHPLPNKKSTTSSKLNLKNQRKKLSRSSNAKKISNQILKRTVDDEVVFLEEVPGSVNISKNIINVEKNSPERKDSKLTDSKGSEKVEVTEHVHAAKNCHEIASHSETPLEGTTLKRNPKRSCRLSKSNRPAKIIKSEALKLKTCDVGVDSGNAVVLPSSLSSHIKYNEIIHSSCQASTLLDEEIKVGATNSVIDNKNIEILNNKCLNDPEKLVINKTLKSKLHVVCDDNVNEPVTLFIQRNNVELNNDCIRQSSEVNSCETFTPCKETITNKETVYKSGDILVKKSVDTCEKLMSSDSKEQNESFGISKELVDVKECLNDMSAFSELSDSNEKEENESIKKVYTPYYIANFRHILNCVLNEEDNKILFNEEDMSFVAAFNSLSDIPQKLYVRLFQRKYKWLRSDKIHYPEITTNAFASLEELSKAHLLDSSSSDMDLETALNLLSLPESKIMAKHFNLNSGKNKEEIKSMLIKHSKQHKSVFFTNNQNSIAKMILKKVKSTIGPCYRLSLLPKKLFTRILMLFNLTLLSEDDDDAAAGGQQQQLLTLLQVNKGELVFPDYKRTKEIAIFADRDELIRYAEARQLETDILVSVEHKKFEKAKKLFIEAKEEYEDQLTKDHIERASSLPVFLKRYTPYHVYIRCMTQGVEILQRLREYKEAVSLLRTLLHQNVFCQDYKGRWYDRLALNLEQHLKKPQEALEEIKNALVDKNVRKGHRYSLLVRALRLTKSLEDEDDFKKLVLREADVIEAPKVIIKGRLCPRSILGRRHVFISSSSVCSNEDDITVVGVEQLTLEYYNENGYPEGIHGEGSTFISLYALLFWDIIYDGNIPDVFICPFQTHPLDLNTDSFFLSREQQITSHLEVLKKATNEDLKEIVKTTWENHHGKASLVSWDRFVDLEHVQGLVACFGSHILSGICERLAKDFRFTRSGVPDLVVWNPETLKVKIVEVKGPGDKLSSKQILWLDYLIKLGADAEVCLVEAEASKKLRK